MKKFSIIAFYTLIAIKCSAQMTRADSLTESVRFDTIVNVPGSQQQLYAKAKAWLVETYVSAKAVIQTEDKEDGYILGKGNFPYTYTLYEGKKKSIRAFDIPGEATAKYSIKIYAMDNKIRLIVGDIIKVHHIGSMDPIESDYKYFEYVYVQDNINSADSEKKARGMSSKSEVDAIDLTFKTLLSSFAKSMNKKSDNDF